MSRKYAKHISRKKASQERIDRKGERKQSQNIQGARQGGACHFRHQAFPKREGYIEKYERWLFRFGHGYRL